LLMDKLTLALRSETGQTQALTEPVQKLRPFGTENGRPLLMDRFQCILRRLLFRQRLLHMFAEALIQLWRLRRANVRNPVRGIQRLTNELKKLGGGVWRQAVPCKSPRFI